ncbi:hypothetical protein ACH4K8_20810 [Streptomyces anulatus]
MNAKRDALTAAVELLGALPMPVGEPMPVELTEQQLDALSAAGNRALNDHYHEDLCYCRSWPTSCASSGYFMGMWDTAAFDIGLPAVIGLWESLRNDRHAAKVAELRAERAQLQDDITGACLARHEEEQENARLRARVAELEAQAEKVTAFCAQRAEYVTSILNCHPDNAHDYFRWQGHAAARRQLSQALGLPVGWPAEDKQSIPSAPVEDPHDSPLHHTYALGRDLPEVTTSSERYLSADELKRALRGHLFGGGAL